jgi:transcriptional regulator with XRE-family HTH domain
MSDFFRTPVENLEHIRSILNPTVTDMAELLRVSRQAIYDWQAGKPIATENALRLADLAQAADVFAVEGLRGSAEVLRRPIRNRKNFFALVGEGGSAENAAAAGSATASCGTQAADARSIRGSWRPDAR